MRVIFNPLSGKFDYVVSSLSDLSGIAAGTATVLANELTCVVTHNLGSVPTVMLEAQGIGGVMRYVTNKTATQFTINLAAAQETNTEIEWEAKII